MSSTTQSGTDARITKEDLESKFQSLQDDLQGRASDKKQSIMAAAAVASAIVVLMHICSADAVVASAAAL